MRLRLATVGTAERMEHVFGPEGGVFGRASRCDWVLPDPQRILSSIHGRIIMQNGGFLLMDESTNGIFLQGASDPVGRGNAVPLKTGMRFHAGPLTLEVEVLPAASSVAAGVSAVPAAAGPVQPLAGRPMGAAPARQAENALRERDQMGDLWGRHSQDPLDYLTGAGAPAARPASGAVDPLAASLLGSPVPPNASPPDVLPPNVLPPDAVALDRPPERASAPIISPGPGLPQSDGPGRSAVAPGAAPVPGPGAGMGSATGLGVGTGMAVGAGMRTSAPQSLPPIDLIAPLHGASSPPSSPSSSPARNPLPHSSPGSAPGSAAERPDVRPPSAKLIPDDFDPLSMLGVAQPRAPAPPTQPVDTFARPAAEPVRRPLSPDLMADLMAIEPRQAPAPMAGTPMPSAPIAAAPIPAAPMAPAPMPPVPLPAAAGQGAAEVDPALLMRQRSDERRARLQDKLEQQSGLSAPGLPSPAQRPMPGAAPRPPAPQMPIPPSPAPMPPGALPAQPTAERGLAQGLAHGVADGGMSAAARALFRGMGFADAPVTRADEERVMQEVGEMVRALTDGVVSLLAARRMVKSEFRMDETQVQPEENNPFKHFRMAELALDELFLTRSGGFLPPGEAAASALDDVKAHVMVTMAAMQRAIRLFADRMDPKVIAREDGEGADRIRGFGARKGKWESYVELHQRLSANLDGVARQIIAEAFSQVQEEHARQAVSQYREDRP